MARSVCGRGSHCLVNSCCCCTSASLPARARHEWPGPAAAAAAAAAAARSSQTQREVRGAPGAGGRASGAWGRGAGGGRARAGRGAARAGPGAPRALAAGMRRRGWGDGDSANCQRGPVPPRGPARPGRIVRAQPRVAGPGRAPCPPRPTRPTIGFLTHSPGSTSPDLAELERTPGGLGDRRGGSRPFPGRPPPRAIAAPASLRPVWRWAPILCRAAGAARPAPS